MVDFNWIVNESNLPWLKLDIEIPHEEMLQEAKAVRHLFVKHRDQDGVGEAYVSMELTLKRLITMNNTVTNQTMKHRIDGQKLLIYAPLQQIFSKIPFLLRNISD